MTKLWNSWEEDTRRRMVMRLLAWAGRLIVNVVISRGQWLFSSQHMGRCGRQHNATLESSLGCQGRHDNCTHELYPLSLCPVLFQSGKALHQDNDKTMQLVTLLFLKPVIHWPYPFYLYLSKFPLSTQVFSPEPFGPASFDARWDKFATFLSTRVGFGHYIETPKRPWP